MDDDIVHTQNENRAFVQAVVYEAKATVYGLTALSAGVVTLASLPLTRLSTWTQSLLGKTAGVYVSRALSAPTEITARTALKFIDMQRSERLKSKAVHAPAEDWPHVFEEAAETLFLGYGAVRDECSEMKMMLPEISYVYKEPKSIVALKPSLVVDLVSKAVTHIGKKKSAYIKAKAKAAKKQAAEEVVKIEKPVSSEWVTAAPVFIPAVIQQMSAPQTIEETARKDGVWISSPPVLMPPPEVRGEIKAPLPKSNSKQKKKHSKKAALKKDVSQPKKAAALKKPQPIVVEQKPPSKPVLTPFLKNVAAQLQSTLQSAGKQAAVLKEKAGEGVIIARQRLEAKRQAKIEAELALMRKAEVRLLEAKTPENVIEQPSQSVVVEKPEEAAPILAAVRVEEAVVEREQKNAEVVEETSSVIAVLEPVAEVAAERVIDVADVLEAVTGLNLQAVVVDEAAPVPIAEAGVEKTVEVIVAGLPAVVHEPEPAAEVIVPGVVETPAVTTTEKIIETVVVEKIVERIVEVEKVVEKIVEVEKAEPVAAAPALAIPSHVTEITPSLLKKALAEKEASQRALKAQVTTITPSMLKKAIEAKEAAAVEATVTKDKEEAFLLPQVPVAYEAPVIAAVPKDEVPAVEDKAAFFLLPQAPVVQETAAVASNEASAADFLFPAGFAATPAEEKQQTKTETADDMAARAAAFLFPPTVAPDIIVQPAMMPVAEVKTPRIAKGYNIASNDNRSSKLPPLKEIPRGVVVSKR